jgi:hypothetical protein
LHRKIEAGSGTNVMILYYLRWNFRLKIRLFVSIDSFAKNNYDGFRKYVPTYVVIITLTPDLSYVLYLLFKYVTM